MTRLAVLAALLFAMPAWSAPDPVAACRAAHRGDPAAHIACLEAALQGRADPPAVAAPGTDEPTGLGAEQVATARRLRDARPEPASVRIVSATYNSRELGVFQLEDGQLWRETERTPRHMRLAADRQYDARIERNVLGGYRMYVDGVRRMLKVERLE
jgi:hypothetical protein